VGDVVRPPIVAGPTIVAGSPIGREPDVSARGGGRDRSSGCFAPAPVVPARAVSLPALAPCVAGTGLC
jgi:hypothetical protein